MLQDVLKSEYVIGLLRYFVAIAIHEIFVTICDSFNASVTHYSVSITKPVDALSSRLNKLTGRNIGISIILTLPAYKRAISEKSNFGIFGI